MHLWEELRSEESRLEEARLEEPRSEEAQSDAALAGRVLHHIVGMGEENAGAQETQSN
jgi:hypothetical protein